MACIDEIKEIDFDLWKWIISGGYFTEIKEIVITSRDPVEGFFTFGKCWHPIKTEETLDQWLDNNFTKRIKYEDVMFLNQLEHPVSVITQEIINRSKLDYNRTVDILIESFDLRDIDGLKRCLDDTNHKYRDMIEESLEFWKIQLLTPKYFNLKSEDIHGITKYLIDVILSTCYNPEFKLVDIPKINVEKFIYGIFHDSVREITSSDNVIWSE